MERKERRWSSSRSSKCDVSGYLLSLDETAYAATSSNRGISSVGPFVSAERRERKVFIQYREIHEGGMGWFQCRFLA